MEGYFPRMRRTCLEALAMTAALGLAACAAGSVATELSEPGVGCDAGGQQTRCELSADGEHYILNGEKKWATSGALSNVFTVMARQALPDPVTGKTTEKITALICTP